MLLPPFSSLETPFTCMLEAFIHCLSLNGPFMSGFSGIVSCISDKFLTATFKFISFLFVTNLSLKISVSVTTLFYCKISKSLLFIHPYIISFLSSFPLSFTLYF